MYNIFTAAKGERGGSRPVVGSALNRPVGL